MRLLRALGLLLIASSATAQRRAQDLDQRFPFWDLGGNAQDSYDITRADGLPTTHAGANLSLRSTAPVPPNGFGVVMGMLRADSLRLRRVHLIADIDAKDVVGGASPWLRINGPGLQDMLALDNAEDRAIKGTASGRIEISMVIPENARALWFGLLLNGTGQATARNLRIETIGTSGGKTSAAAQALLDTTIALAKTYALWRDTVTWSALLPKVQSAARGAQTADEVYPAIRFLLSQLGDHHSFLMKPSGAAQTLTGAVEDRPTQAKALDGRVGYLSVFTHRGMDTATNVAFAQALQDSIISIVPHARCGWVVDLRENGGGNMWPMLGGLRPLLGEGVIGSFISGGVASMSWHARDGIDVRPVPQLAPLESAYVAVLTSPRTGSSGEAVAISFRERPHTRSFGLPTAGLSTANATFRLPDGSMLQLTTSVEADRTGHRYGQQLQPDEEITLDAHPSNDPPLMRAVAWLESRPGC
jgi:C-terminal processing protease CtpA/Prc